MRPVVVEEDTDASRRARAGTWSSWTRCSSVTGCSCWRCCTPRQTEQPACGALAPVPSTRSWRPTIARPATRTQSSRSLTPTSSVPAHVARHQRPAEGADAPALAPLPDLDLTGFPTLVGEELEPQAPRPLTEQELRGLVAIGASRLALRHIAGRCPDCGLNRRSKVHTATCDPPPVPRLRPVADESDDASPLEHMMRSNRGVTG